MPRPPRLLLSKSFYHIMTRGNNRQDIFCNRDDYEYYLNLIFRYKKELPFFLYHYCLMPNHIHFLIKTKNSENFIVFMKKLNLAYSYYYRQKTGWVGHLWQDRYKSQAVGKDEYFIQCGKYIELNPVRKGIIINPKDYLYSSYQYYGFGEPNELITEDFFYKDFGNDREERQKNYRKMIINEIVERNYGQKVWGTKKQKYNEQQKINRHLAK